jgi:hypothetical protein
VAVLRLDLCIPEIICFILGLPKFLEIEQAPPFGTEERDAGLTGEFRADLDIVPLGIKVNILVFKINSAAAFGSLLSSSALVKQGNFVLDLVGRIVRLYIVDGAVQDIYIEIGAF